MEVPEKLKTELLYDPAIPFLGREDNNSKRYKHLSVHCNTIYNIITKTCRQPKFAATWMGLEILLSEVS